MTRHSQSLYRQRGFLAIEPIIAMLLFFFVMVLANNGIVNLIKKEWSNAARSAALAGAQKLYEEEGKPNAGQDAIDEAISFALLHEWLGSPIQAGQVSVTSGQWSSCVFTPDLAPPDAVRVDITAPVDAAGNPTGITALFGQLQAPMLEVLPALTTAVGAVVDYQKNEGESSSTKTAYVLVEYQGQACSQ